MADQRPGPRREAPPQKDRDVPMQQRPDDEPSKTIREGQKERQPEEPHGPSKAV